MDKRYLSLSILFAFILITGLALAEDAVDVGDMSAALDETSDDAAVPVEDETAIPSSDTIAAEASPDNATEAETGAEEVAPEPVDLNYIWSATVGDEQITMVLNQEGDEIYGQAKFEGDDPWNALVAGTLSGNDVWLVMTALEGDSLMATKLVGTYAEDTITGTFTQYDAGGKIGSGDFMAMWINPNKSDYSPVVIKKEEAVAVSAPEEAASPAAGTGVDTSRFVDVRKYKDQITPAGVIAPGMG